MPLKMCIWFHLHVNITLWHGKIIMRQQTTDQQKMFANPQCLRVVSVLHETLKMTWNHVKLCVIEAIMWITQAITNMSYHCSSGKPKLTLTTLPLNWNWTKLIRKTTNAQRKQMLDMKRWEVNTRISSSSWKHSLAPEWHLMHYHWLETTGIPTD